MGVYNHPVDKKQPKKRWKLWLSSLFSLVLSSVMPCRYIVRKDLLTEWEETSTVILRPAKTALPRARDATCALCVLSALEIQTPLVTTASTALEAVMRRSNPANQNVNAEKHMANVMSVESTANRQNHLKIIHMKSNLLNSVIQSLYTPSKTRFHLYIDFII